jgi:hypothetical protein
MGASWFLLHKLRKINELKKYHILNSLESLMQQGQLLEPLFLMWIDFNLGLA